MVFQLLRGGRTISGSVIAAAAIFSCCLGIWLYTYGNMHKRIGQIRRGKLALGEGRGGGHGLGEGEKGGEGGKGKGGDLEWEYGSVDIEGGGDYGGRKGLKSVINAKMAKIHEVLCSEDEMRKKKMLQLMMEPSNITVKSFYMLIMNPFVAACTNMKRLGGQWAGGGFDGSKYVCLDDLEDNKKPCIVYSFGIGSDVSFETAMHDMGCTVNAYDHTISEWSQEQLNRVSQHKLFLHQLGVGNVTKGNLTTLEDAVAENGHQEAEITYLKADIEGDEKELLPLWLNSSVFDRVKQFGMEFHGVTDPKNVQIYYQLLLSLNAKGFELISFEPNFSAMASVDGLFSYFEVVFIKVDLIKECGWQ